MTTMGPCQGTMISHRRWSRRSDSASRLWTSATRCASSLLRVTPLMVRPSF